MKRMIAAAALIAASCLALAGCFGMTEPQPTVPPQLSFGSAQEFSDAVAKAKADSSADDVENLRGVDHYFIPQAVPDNASMESILVSSEAIIAQYALGQANGDDPNSQIQFGWYRTLDANSFLDQMSQSLTNSGYTYDAITEGGITYLHTVPALSIEVTNPPGSTAATEPSPTTGTPCQVVYWVQDGAALVAIVPIGFTNDDIGKYCQAERVGLQ